MTEKYIFRTHTGRDFTMINNAVFRSGLSLAARGLVCTIVSKCEDWEVRTEALARELQCSENLVRTSLQELARKGFLMRKREQGEGGKVYTVTLVADSPVFLGEGDEQARICGYGYPITDPELSEGRDNDGSVPTPKKPRGRSTEGSVSSESNISIIPQRKEEVSKESVQADAAPAHRSPRPAKGGSEPHPETQAIVKAYLDLVGTEGLTKDTIGRECRTAKEIAQAGWTAAQVAYAYKLYKAEKFWQDKHLSLSYIAKQLPELKRMAAEGKAPKMVLKGEESLASTERMMEEARRRRGLAV